MRMTVKLIATAFIGSAVLSPPAIAAPALPKTAPQVGMAMTAGSFFRFQGGCFVHYTKTTRTLSGKWGPAGYERYQPTDYTCFFEI